ncbi:aminopeptidase [Brevibacillus formosus]|uniref:Aminopeptidase n=1 Tax=Brevibacillus formosus TaxID=54913 RepID=A0A837KIB2_9BACL|nr:aminopeptidase [Brevibacillus formosus]KLH96226.1 aminopeptidase [Brevibacillus formosus]MED1959029.1 aminopeptidase [Brevibacillus formosus]PSJ90938.1 aminopeptidase [Brevibacillus formosus]GED59780.1 aminopeptidase [Brevibacillus formosus]
MRDERLGKIADNLISYSMDVQAKQHIMIMVVDEGEPLAMELVKRLYAKGAYPHLRFVRPQVQREWLKGLTEEQLAQTVQWEKDMWFGMQGYIGIHGETNDSEMKDVPQEKYRLYAEAYDSIFHYVDNQITGLRINYPTSALAQKANMTTEAFEDFYFNVCSLDYRKMAEACQPLYDLMDKTDKVRIVGPGTDLTFSIKGIGTRTAVGKRNIPDGEVYTSPVRDSIHGTISYNTPSNFKGTTFENVRFTFREGKIVEAHANHADKLTEILDTDEGARYIGEFAIAFNPYILHPMGDTLFDEKIAGSFHLTPGRAYDQADNGNRSAIHWDLICIQRPEYGGGEIWFDDVLIRKDGRFVHEALLGLNPEQLIL